MKNLKTHAFDAKSCRVEWNNFSNLLKSKTKLSERKDVLPFFKKSINLSALICNYFPKITNPDCQAHEFQIYGDFVADLVVGDSSEHRYVLIEFENGEPESVFKKKGKKSTPDWAPRLEGAYSQLTDWLWKLEDMRSTGDFQNTFGSRRATFQGLIVIGKDMNLSAQEQDRLKKKKKKTKVDSIEISIVSFNELEEHMDAWLKRYYGV